MNVTPTIKDRMLYSPQERYKVIVFNGYDWELMKEGEFTVVCKNPEEAILFAKAERELGRDAMVIKTLTVYFHEIATRKLHNLVEFSALAE